MSAEPKTTFEERTDGLQNALSGLGDPTVDKGQAGEWKRGGLLSRGTLETMYVENDLAATIVDALPDDARRAGVKVSAGTDEVAGENEEEDPFAAFLRDFNVVDHFAKASKWARLYGGAAIIIGAKDGRDPDQPLDVDNLESIAWLQVVDMWELMPASFNNDFQSPNYNEPETYNLYPTNIGGLATGFGAVGEKRVSAQPEKTQQVVHHTRVIRFEGDEIPTRLSASVGYWGLSVLQKTKQKVEQFLAVEQSMANRIQEAQYDAVFLHGLGETLDQDNGEEKVRKRILTMSMGKGPVKALVMDGEDRWENRVAQFTGLFEIYDAFASSLAAAAKMSRVRLFGEPPGGMSTDDRAGRANWHDQVDSFREDEWRVGLEYLIELAMLASDGPTSGVVPDDWSVEFGDLEQLTPLEEAEQRKAYAEMDHLYWQMAVLTAEEIRRSRFGAAEYGINIQLRDDDPLAGLESEFGDPEAFEPAAGVPGVVEEPTPRLDDEDYEDVDEVRYDPFSSLSELPPNVREKLSEAEQRQWMKVFNRVLEETDDEGRAFAAAWSVVE